MYLCLIHLPQAALAVTAIVTIPYLIYYFSLGDAVYIAIALNILLVTIVMIRVLLNSHRGFVRLVRSEAETQRLNREVTVLAHTDPLTRLPNRRLFFSEVSSRIGLMVKRAAGSAWELLILTASKRSMTPMATLSETNCLRPPESDFAWLSDLKQWSHVLEAMNSPSSLKWTAKQRRYLRTRRAQLC